MSANTNTHSYSVPNSLHKNPYAVGLRVRELDSQTDQTDQTTLGRRLKESNSQTDLPLLLRKTFLGLFLGIYGWFLVSSVYPWLDDQIYHHYWSALGQVTYIGYVFYVAGVILGAGRLDFNEKDLYVQSFYVSVKVALLHAAMKVANLYVTYGSLFLSLAAEIFLFCVVVLWVTLTVMVSH